MRTSNRNSLFSWVLRRRSTPYFTHGTLHFRTNNGGSLVDAAKPASHQYWGQVCPLVEWMAKAYLGRVPTSQQPCGHEQVLEGGRIAPGVVDGLQQVLEGAGGNAANCPQKANSFGGSAGQMNPLRAPRSAVTASCQNAGLAMTPDAPEAHAISVWRRRLFQAAPPTQGSDPFIPK